MSSIISQGSSSVYSQNAGIVSLHKGAYLSNAAPSSSTLTGPNGPFVLGNFILTTAGNLYYLASISTVAGVTSATWSELSASAGGILPVSEGGTGDSTLTAHGVLIGEGTSPVHVTTAGTLGQPLVSGGASADPAFALLGVVGGGTGVATLTAHGVVLGEGTSAVAVTAAGTSGQVLTSGGASADGAYQSIGVNSGLSGIILGNNTSAFTTATYVPNTAWTPALAINGSTTGITYTSTPTGFYQIVGGTVFFTASLSLLSKGVGTGAVSINNMPIAFGTNGVFNNIGIASFGAVTLTASYTSIVGQGNNSSVVLSFLQVGSGESIMTLSDAQLADASTIAISGFYFTN